MTSTMQTTGTNRNRLVLFGALGVLLLLAALVLPRTLFGGGGGGGDELGPPPDASGSSGTTTTTVPPEDLAALPGPEAFSTKNPFTPLVDAAPAAATADPALTGGTSATGGVSDVPSPTATGTGTGTGTGSIEPSSSGGFSLIDVYAGPDGAPVATVEVDGQMYTVSEGDTFAGGYRVVSLSIADKSGVFTSPSDGSEFAPSAGESVLK